MPIVGCSAYGETWQCWECSKHDDPAACLEFRQNNDIVVHKE